MKRSFSSRTAATLALFPLVALAGGPAGAHVTLEQREAAPGAAYKAVLKVPHGCGASPTQAIRVEIPEGFFNVKPMPKPGWSLDTVKGPYATSYSLHGRTLTEGVKEITWAEGNLPDEHYDEFVAAGFLGKELAGGSALYFKVTQTCAEGERQWAEVPDGTDGQKLASPAAVLRLAASGDHTGPKDAGGTAKSGALAIEGAWARATPHGAKVGAGYLTILNTGSTADTLIAISAPVAGKSEVHDMTMTDGVMRMRALPEGIEIPAGGTVTLAPGGKHLMFMDLKEPLVAGASLPVTLTFKNGGTVEATFPIRPIGGDKKDGGAAKDDHDHHHHH
ncbi:MAG TPA: DUF1775 domain-containing protein [Hyphomicrobium sp.]|nr:DUF1775 domain-containing protein [Hyphomicrobium sp.]